MSVLARFAAWSLLLSLLVPTVSRGESGGAGEVGGRMPDFSMRSFDGQTVTRSSFQGRPLLIVFWNTWCPVCLRELPEISRLDRRFGPAGLSVLAVNTALNDSEEKARAYWKGYGYRFPAGFDGRFEMGQAFRVRGVPTVFLVDAGGIIRYKQATLSDDIQTRLRMLTRH